MRDKGPCVFCGELDNYRTWGLCESCCRDFPDDEECLEASIKAGYIRAFTTLHRRDCRFPEPMHWYCREIEFEAQRLEFDDPTRGRDCVIFTPRCVGLSEVAEIVNRLFDLDLVPELYCKCLMDIALPRVHKAPYNVSSVQLWGNPKPARYLDGYFSLAQIINYIHEKEETKWLAKLRKLNIQMSRALKSDNPREALKSLRSEFTRDGTLPT